jgi:D-alanyl-lipoteichoic acid acyltransferase DltB (MBOAT superfamily)
VFFDSPVYILFLAIVVAVYWRLGRLRQNQLLLVASYFFYGWWDLRFLALMIINTLVDYSIAHRIARTEEPRARAWWLTASLILNFGCLGFFKYFNFFIDSAATMMRHMGVAEENLPRAFLQIVLPAGISFYTFQAVAYIIDVYGKKLKATNSLTDYALFISLFPHLIAGPIQRPGHLLPQVAHERTFHAEAFHAGLMLILTGLLRKCVLGDNCALLANAAFSGRLGEPSAWTALIGMYAFAWQIYGDFSGYSDIARGSAQLMGFHFMVNFRQPYLATSLQDFWRRWHISLSTWLLDYLYIPLGGNRKGPLRTYVNLMTTMLLGGLWHGANWTFVIWGGIHGVGLAVERFFGLADAGAEKRSFIGTWARRIVIFHLVCLAWVFFRALSLNDSMTYLGQIGSLAWSAPLVPATVMLVGFTLPFFLMDLGVERARSEYIGERSPLIVQDFIGVMIVVILVLFSAANSNAFIYFQF